MNQPKPAVLRLVHASLQKLPFEEHELSFTAGLAPVVCWSFAGAAEGQRGLAASVEGQYTGENLQTSSQDLYCLRGLVQYCLQCVSIDRIELVRCLHAEKYYGSSSFWYCCVMVSCRLMLLSLCSRSNIAQHSPSQRKAAQHSTAQHSTAQHSTAQHSTAQHSTAQHSTAQERCQKVKQIKGQTHLFAGVQGFRLEYGWCQNEMIPSIKQTRTSGRAC